MLNALFESAGGVKSAIASRIGHLELHDKKRSAGFFELRILCLVQQAEADAKPKIGVLPQTLEQRQHHLSHSHWIFSGLDVDVGDTWR